ncbi:hypothetical protein JVU11DRAFT_1425 [Chiua virens]|nr:hypothetical protein JVU11DRAFT_1425 [Chiua virens]
MVHWKDPHAMAMEAVDFNNMVHALCGLYVWELIVTFDFEVSIIRGKRKVGWPLVTPFFLCRYGMLWALIGLYVAGNTTIASASTSLMIRTVALWEWRRWVTITIAAWDESNSSCVVVNTNHLLLNLNYSYTMTFDFIILLFTTVILGRYSQPNAGLSGLLFRDGLIYFLVTSICNTIPAVSHSICTNTRTNASFISQVLNLLNLNDEMNVYVVHFACFLHPDCPYFTKGLRRSPRPLPRKMIVVLFKTEIDPLAELLRHAALSSVSGNTLCRPLQFSYFARPYLQPADGCVPGKASVPQTHRRTNPLSFEEEFGTRNAANTTFHDPSASKLPNYVEFTPLDGTVNSVDSVLKIDESQALPPKDNAFVSPV